MRTGENEEVSALTNSVGLGLVFGDPNLIRGRQEELSLQPGEQEQGSAVIISRGLAPDSVNLESTQG